MTTTDASRVRVQLGADLRVAADGFAGVAADVEFLGEQDLLAPLLSVADVFLLPSIQESFGLAALEAMACSVPVVAARIGGLPEVIEDGVTGFLHPPDDLDVMAAAAVRVLTDAPLHAAMSQAARAVARERYTDARIVPSYERYYTEILERGPAG